MKRNAIKVLFYALFLVAPIFLYAGCQAAGMTDQPPEQMPVILLLPYAFGIFVHWAKKYMADGVTVNFWTWMASGWVTTIVSLIVGLGSLTAMYLGTNHGGLWPLGYASFMAAFWVGVGADTLNMQPSGQQQGTAGTSQAAKPK